MRPILSYRRLGGFLQILPLRPREPLIHGLLYWEGKFAKPGIGYKGTNGMTYDGALLDPITGLVSSDGAGRDNSSSASTEALQIMVLVHALDEHPDAGRFVAPWNHAAAPAVAYNIMHRKGQTYLHFNASFLGFGGFLPWYDDTYNAIRPARHRSNLLSSLGNGQLLWAVYAATRVLLKSNKKHFQVLGAGWLDWLDYASANAAQIFYRNSDGAVCEMATFNQSLHPTHPDQIYSCEGSDRLDDPHEGELFTWWLYFFENLHSAGKAALWTYKRPRLRRRKFEAHGFGPITVDMVSAKRMQSCYGSADSERFDGTAISNSVSWEGKITTAVALLGGVAGHVRAQMEEDGIYEEFIEVTEREYGQVFDNLEGEHVELCLPRTRVLDGGPVDYTVTGVTGVEISLLS
ncbi:hypothetical protein MBLNU230_g1832t1 [Neophaeotheca triangularis]